MPIALMMRISAALRVTRKPVASTTEESSARTNSTAPSTGESHTLRFAGLRLAVTHFNNARGPATYAVDESWRPHYNFHCFMPSFLPKAE
jgi:hypothetical protein